MRRFILSLALSLALPAAAFSEPVYECPVNPGASNGGWITPLYAFQQDSKAGTIEVFDGLIKHFNKGEPVQGTVTKDTETQLAFRWSIFTMDPAGQRTKLNFRGVFYRSTGEFSVQAEPVGYTNRFSARGTCAPAK